ncbi:SRPBCC family protein [Sulfurimonas sp.]|jgi:ligand-binding SRPBCC domain-containing protein|uniref:SRPBCC family protein n=1 Tax=Sulfurimonas sp. TaxID=2022749 RepID=UPI0025E454A0|nr:SRPBCC family protein [Sulfurimonas sp.]MBT5934890.1 SRPBCC family protein [Sulfurimonas sp.]
MRIYEKTSLIECSLKKLYDFHLDMKNLKAISPKGIKVTLLNEGFVPKEGAILRLKTVKNFLPIIWEVKIDKMDAPNLLVDVAMKSPFKSWRHSHIFTQVDENICELKDVVEYTLPFGFLGSLFNFFIQYELRSMFNFRHLITQKLLEGKR